MSEEISGTDISNGVPGSKTVEYEDFIGRKGKVVYELRGNKVIFSSLRSAREATSTIQAAELVVKAICNAEGIDWENSEFGNKYEFYDLSTPIGYPSRKDDYLNRLLREGVGLGEVEIDRLNIVHTNGTIFVESWTPMNLSSNENTLQALLPSAKKSE